MRYEWILRHYNLVGGGITAASYDGSVSNQIRHATDRQVHFVLDNYEELSFSLYLDDPMAATIQPMTSVIKLWRNIYNDSGSLIYSDPSYQPCFGGFVTFVEKSGERNIMSVKVFSPLWRLKTRFHIRNHYTKTNPQTGNPYTQSELIWQFIHWLQAAFPGPGYTYEAYYSYMGMERGTFSWAQDPVMGPYFQGKGANGWANIFDSLMSRAESPELIPRYFHANGSSIVMFLDTNKARGTDKSASVNFRFHTGSSDNLTDIVETIDVQEPGAFANYVWAWGAGGPNSGKLAMVENISDDAYGYQNVKVYQYGGYYADISRFDDTLTDIATGELKKRRRPPSAYALTVSPAITGPFYGANYAVGDAVSLSASKGALSIGGVKQRIYECTLSISDNNIEIAEPLIGHDDKEHVYSS